MPTHTNRKAKVFVVNALLDLPGDEGEWLAEIKTQITQMGRVINERDPEQEYLNKYTTGRDSIWGEVSDEHRSDEEEMIL